MQHMPSRGKYIFHMLIGAFYDTPVQVEIDFPILNTSPSLDGTLMSDFF